MRHLSWYILFVVAPTFCFGQEFCRTEVNVQPLHPTSVSLDYDCNWQIKDKGAEHAYFMALESGEGYNRFQQLIYYPFNRRYSDKEHEKKTLTKPYLTQKILAPLAGMSPKIISYRLCMISLKRCAEIVYEFEVEAPAGRRYVRMVSYTIPFNYGLFEYNFNAAAVNKVDIINSATSDLALFRTLANRLMIIEK